MQKGARVYRVMCTSYLRPGQLSDKTFRLVGDQADAFRFVASNPSLFDMDMNHRVRVIDVTKDH